MGKTSKQANYTVTGSEPTKVPKPSKTTSTSITNSKPKVKEVKTAETQLLDHKKVFAKKTQVQQLEHDNAIKDLEIDKLRTHIGYLTIITVLSILAALIAIVTSIIWG